MKLAAVWLIYQAGLKGKIKGNVGIQKKQALIIIKLGGATGPEILKVSEEVQDIVNKKFGVILEREVNVI